MKWYGSFARFQDKFTPYGTQFIQAEQFQNDNIAC